MSHTLEPNVRSLTDVEIEQFRQNGWVFLKGYLDPESTASLLRQAKARFALETRGDLARAATQPDIEADSFALHWDCAALKDEGYREVSFHPQTARNLERLSGRTDGFRYYNDAVAVKPPASWGAHSAPTTYHQDFRAFPIDQAASMTCWIALDAVTPEMGSLRFGEGTDRDDYLLGVSEWGTYLDMEEVYDAYPWLRVRGQPSSLLTYQPGDATIHNSRIVHGAPANGTSDIRWNFATSYFPADARFTGADGHATRGLGMKIGATLDHSTFPRV